MKAQRLQIAQALVQLAQNVTANDRTKCAKQYKISKQTICNYLSGKVTNSDRGLQILEFMIKRIDERQKEIKQLWTK